MKSPSFYVLTGPRVLGTLTTDLEVPACETLDTGGESILGGCN